MSDLTTDIVESAKRGDAEAVVRLIQANPFVPKQDTMEPALLAAAEFGQLAVVRACIMDLRCNPNCVDKNGRSPLHMSVVRKQNGKIAISIIKFLVSKGSKIRKSVLHVCGNDLAVFPLIELGADVNANSVDGLTPLSVAVAADRQEVVSELIRAKANVDSDLIFKAQSSQVIKDLVRHKIEPNTRDKFGNTALFYAVESGNKSLARALLQVGADAKQFSITRSNSVASDNGGSLVTPVGKSPLGSSENHDIVQRLQSVYDSLSNEKSWDGYLPDQLVEIEKLASRFIAKTKEIRDSLSQKLSASLCVVCRSEHKSVLVMPCRHLCMCSECSNALSKGGTWEITDKLDQEITAPACPVCRAAVVELVSVYT